jgi:hypothetical protein
VERGRSARANFETELGYDPATAENFDLIQMSPLALSPEQVALYRKQGFVIVSDPSMAYFSYAYHRIYVADVPVFVSADSVLDVVHRSYDELLQDLELAVLSPALEDLLSGLRVAAATNETLPLEVRTDVDFFLARCQTDSQAMIAEWSSSSLSPRLPQGSNRSSSWARRVRSTSLSSSREDTTRNPSSWDRTSAP